ncbi:MAG: YigZ family protein [Clostridiales bacterium]
MEEKIITIKSSLSCEFEEKKSKFISHITPIKTESEGIEFINKIKSMYWDATHNVYAYYIKKNSVEFQKYSDDSEPRGTAGIPVLNAIKKNNLQDICIVVTRYFGGTMLGASGLVRAYGKSATNVINNSEKLIKQYCIETYITIDYGLYNKLSNFLRNKKIKIYDLNFSQDVDLKCYIPYGILNNTIREIVEKLNDQVLIETGKKGYFAVF